MKLILAEKPSLGRIIDSALKKNNISGFKVLSLRGHLVEPINTNSSWNIDNLPLSNDEIGKGTGFKAKTGDADIKKRISDIKNAINDPSITEIYSAGDPDAEGSNLVIQLLEYLKFVKINKNTIVSKKPIFRMIFNDMTDSTFVDSFKNAKNIDTDLGLIYASKSRNLADSIVGFNLSRLFGLLYGSFGEKISVGRVQTPTLYIVRDREIEIETFVPKDKFSIKAHTKVGIFEYKGELLLDTYKKLAPKVNDEIFITNISSSSKTVTPEQPCDNNDTLVFMNKKYKWPISKTTKVLQELYESAFISYPRTDTGFLPTAEFNTVSTILKKLSNVPSNLPNLNIKNKNVFNDDKVDAHFGIIPLKDYPNDSSDKSLLFEYIKAKFIMSFMSDLKKLETIVSGKTSLAPKSWILKGVNVTNKGFTNYLNGKFISKTKENVIPDIKKNESYIISKVDSTKSKTTPPSLIKVTDLLKKMKSVSIKGVDGNDSTKSIGTSATRGSIVTNLIKSGKLLDSPKGLTTTDSGKKIYNIAKNDISLQVTAQFETFTKDISLDYKNSFFKSEKFFIEINDFVKSIIEKHKLNPLFPKPSDFPMKDGFSEFSKGFKLVKGNNEYIIWKQSFGRTFSKSDAKKLLVDKKSVTFTNLVSTKTKKKYTATLTYDFKNKKFIFKF